MIRKIKIIFLRLLVIFASFILVLGCDSHELSNFLNKADAVIESSPDSALKILEEAQELKNSRDSALFGLLTAQAKIKLDRTDIDTMMLAKSQCYFNKYPESDFRLRANFYKGYIEYANADFAEAIKPMTLANLEAREKKMDIWIGRTSTHLSLIMNRFGLTKYNLSYDSLAFNAFKKLDMKRDYFLSKIDLGLALASLYEFHAADKVFEDIFLEISQIEYNDSIVMLYLLEGAVKTKMELKEFREAESLFNLMDSYRGFNKHGSSNYSYRAKLNVIKGNLDMARLLLDSAESCIRNAYDSEVYNKAKASFAKMSGDKKMERIAEEELGKITYRYSVEANTNPVGLIHNRTIIEYEKKKTVEERRGRIIGWSISVLLLALSVALFLFYICRRKKSFEELSRNRAQLENMNGELDSARKELESKNAQIENIERKFENLKRSFKANKEGRETLKEFRKAYEHDIPLIIKLCDSFAEINGPLQNERARILDLKEELTAYFSGERLEYLIKIIDVANKNVISEFKKVNQSFKDIDITLFALFSSGFSGKSISLLTGLSRNSVYQRKRRLIERLKRSGLQENASYLAMIEEAGN